MYVILLVFIQNEIDLAMFTTLKGEDLVIIGIRSFGARKMMLSAIQGKIFSVTYGDLLLANRLRLLYILLLELHR